MDGCPLCGAQRVSPKSVGIGGVWRVECPTCGTFGIEMGATYRLRDYAGDRYRLSALAREASIQRKGILFVDGSVPAVFDGFEPLQITEAVTTRFPRLVGELLDRVLLNLSRLSDHPGFKLHCTYSETWPVFFARNRDEAAFYARALLESGRLEYRPPDQPNDTFFAGCVSPRGWIRIAELEAANDGQPPTQAFVAMWFGNEKVRKFCLDAFMRGFKIGIESAGYSARRIDFKEFNDDIMDEVIAEIRRSRFVVADFTGQRPGVYYEAGFARGLGLPVIFTCHKEDLAAAHFDTNHMNHIAWETPTDLATRLEKRIVATVGPGPLKPPRGEA